MPSKSPKRKSRSKKSRSKPYTVKVKCSRKNKKQCARAPLSCTRDKRAIPERKNSKTTLRPRCRSRGKTIIARDAARRIQNMFRKSKSKSKSKSKTTTINGKDIKVPPKFLKQDGTIKKNYKKLYNKWKAKQRAKQ